MSVEHEDQVDRLIAEYLTRVDRGETVNREEYLATYPDAADALREFFETADRIEALAGPVVTAEYESESLADLGTHAESDDVEEVDSASVAVADTLVSLDKPLGSDSRTLTEDDDEPHLPPVFGRYRIEKELGRGGMGAVYLAYDTELDRRVALKVPTFRGPGRRELVERFNREARAAATLRHTNICPVYDVGQIDGIRYISMAYIEGRSLGELVRFRGPLPSRDAAELIRRLASALADAHEKGTIHRDLKPTNVMIDERGEPVVMDFGLARQVHQEEDERLTREGVILGSPAYMSPEQVHGDAEALGPRCDIYSLGVILYELLTGRVPFRGKVTSVFAQILRDEPPSPRSLVPEIDERLEAICLKMMAKEPARRHATMDAVEVALTDYLNSSPDAASTIVFSPPPPPRNRQLVLAGLLGFVGLVALGIVLFFRVGDTTVRVVVDDPETRVEIQGQTITVHNDGEAIRIEPGDHKLKVERGGLTFTTPQFTLEEGDKVTLLVEVVEGELLVKQDDKLLDARTLEAAKTESARTGIEFPQPQWTTLFNGRDLSGWKTHPDMPGNWKVDNGALTAANGQPARLFSERGDYKDFHLRAEIKVSETANGGVHFRSEFGYGFDVAQINGKGVIPISYEAELATSQGRFAHFPTGSVYRLGNIHRPIIKAISDEVRANEWFTLEIVVDGTERKVLVNGKLVTEFREETPIREHGHIALAATAPTVHYRKIEIRELNKPVQSQPDAILLVHKFEGHKDIVHAVGYSTDGKIVSLADDETLRVWDPETAREVDCITGVKSNSAAAVSPDGAFAAAATNHGGGGVTIEVWDVAARRLVRRVTEGAEPFHWVRQLIFRPGHRHVLAVGNPGLAVLWDFETGQELKRFSLEADWVSTAAFSPDGKTIVVGTFRPQRLSVWDVESGKRQLDWEAPRNSVPHALQFLPDGKHFLTGTGHGLMSLFRVGDATAVRTFAHGEESTVEAMQVLGSGRHVVTGTHDRGGLAGALTLWDLETGQQLARAPCDEDLLKQMAVSPDGRTLVTGRGEGWSEAEQKYVATGDYALRLWRLPPRFETEDEGEPLPLHEARRFEGHSDHVSSVAISADGKMLISSASDGTLKVWDIETRRVLHTLHGLKKGFQTNLGVSPDGRFVAVGDWDGRVRVWDLQSPEKSLADFPAHIGGVFHVSFSPDGSTLLTTGEDAQAHLWHVATGELKRDLIGHGGGISDGVFSPDGRQVLTTGFDKTIRLWDTWTGEESLRLTTNGQTAHCVAFAPDGQTVAAGFRDGSVRISELERGEEVLRLIGHTDRVQSVAFTPDGRHLVSGAYDCTLRVWDVSTGREIARAEQLKRVFNTLAITPDGRHVATAGGIWKPVESQNKWDLENDPVIRLWRLPEDSFIADSVSPIEKILQNALVVMNFEQDTFYEQDGKTYVRDLSGHGNDGQCNGEARFTANGIAGRALGCSGGEVQLPPLLNDLPSFTLTAWIRRNEFGQDRLFERRVRPGEPLAIVHFAPKSCRVSAVNTRRQGTDEWESMETPLGSVPAKDWFFIAVRLKDGGVRAGELQVTIDERHYHGKLQSVHGSRGGDSLLGPGLNGQVDEFAVFDRALSEAEITALYHHGRAGKPLPSLVTKPTTPEAEPLPEPVEKVVGQIETFLDELSQGGQRADGAFDATFDWEFYAEFEEFKKVMGSDEATRMWIGRILERLADKLRQSPEAKRGLESLLHDFHGTRPDAAAELKDFRDAPLDDEAKLVWNLIRFLNDVGPPPVELKPQFPAAAGIPNAVWGIIADAQAQPEIDAFPSTTLSVLLLSLNPVQEAQENPDVLKDFRYLTETPLPRPAQLSDALWISKRKGYASFIQPEYITEVTVTIENETAFGEVAFEAPDVYRGRIGYVARQSGAEWRIEEFHLPHYGLSVRRTENGAWERSEKPNPVPARAEKP